MDIDIDFLNRNDALDKIKHIVASRDINTQHNTGIYVHNIPHNPITNLSTINYKDAEQRGYFKIDFLNVNVYNGVRDQHHLLKLMGEEPLWQLLIEEEFVKLLFHLNEHIDILRKTQPTSVEQLAAVLSMIRPAKRYLIGKDWTTVMKEVWIPPTDGSFYFKKAHAISYAVVIVVQMNLICETLFTTPN